MKGVVDDLRPGRVDVTLEKLCLTPDEAANVLSVGRTTVYELLARGELASISIGRARRIPLVSLKAFVAEALERFGPAGVCQTSAIVPQSGTKDQNGESIGAIRVASGARTGRVSLGRRA